MTTTFDNTADALLELLALRGIDYFLANSGTDFTGIVEGFARRAGVGKIAPAPMAIPHENPLMAMAHGYYLATGKPLATMTHVNVGTANTMGAIMNAHRSRVPILFMAGRTPVTESGHHGSRRFYIHWNQESFDQASMLREYVKWDYELREPSQLEAVVDRALAIAMSEPRGPVYLTLPRETLTNPYNGPEFSPRHRYDLPTLHPDPEKIRMAADLMASARFPLVVVSAACRRTETVKALVELADLTGCGVVSLNPEFHNFPIGHPAHLGFDPQALFADTDLIIAIECDVPWYPHSAQPEKKAKIVHIGVDPFFSHLPIRTFPSDVTIQSEPTSAIAHLIRQLTEQFIREVDVVETRKRTVENRHREITGRLFSLPQTDPSDTTIDPAWASTCLNALLGEDTMVVNEFDNCMKHQPNLKPGQYFCSPHGGHLGWGLGAALGVKLGRPDKTVICTVGDGSYIFNVPSACHAAAAMHHLPVLTVVYNNQSWHAVKRATLGMYPDGHAARSGDFPLSRLHPDAGFEKICEAFGGYGEKVVDRREVGPALTRALHVVREGKRQALVNLVCRKP
jgi:acetolactate synthase-1/2/3 large subunit